MGALFASVLTWFAGSLLARVLVGAGLSLLTVSWLGGYVNQLLSSVTSSLGGMPGSALSLLELAGLGPALSAIGSAIVARVAIVAAGQVLGVAKS